MTTARSIACDSCGSDVPSGRLSCPACGDLLASVAGGSRRASVAPLARTGTAPSTLHAVEAASYDVASAGDGASAGATSRAGDQDGLSALTEETATGWDDATTWDEDTAGRDPGAWVPPRSPIDEDRLPSGVAAPARAWGGHAPRIDAVAPSGHVAPSTAAGVAGAADDVHPASADPVDGARLAEFIGWLAIAGGALSAVGFLLPWGPSMIGAVGTEYVSRWGIAGPFHIVIALMVVALVVLAVVPNPVPAWIRVGIAGTMLAAFLLGLAWPYVFGLSSTGPGALAVAVGAVVLLAAGIICLGTDRHRPASPAV